MKKIYILLAAFAALTLSSCVNEQLENGGTIDLSNRDIAFVFGGKAATRAEVASNDLMEENGVSISLGSEAGMEIFLKETVEDLNATRLATRGTPIYDENLTTVDGYHSFEAVTYYKGAPYANGTGVFTSMDYQKNVDNRDGWVYKRHYNGTLPWPNKTDNLYFYLRMPTDYIDANLKNGTSIEYKADGSIEFDYSSPLTGESQKDILFSSRTLNQTEYEENYVETGAPVTMYHALTGVKFRVGNNNDGTTKTIIRSVEIIGLNDEGHCIVTPSSGIVSWPAKEQTMNYGTFKLDFDDFEYKKEGDNTISYAKPSESVEESTEGTEKPMEFGDSWYSAASDKNLNDENGSLTFWLIPQVIPDNAILKVTFCIKTPDTAGETGGGMITHTIENFGAKLKKGDKPVEWKAGQLRTYTLEPEDVDVDIFDKMTGYVKNNLHVTNTGNVDEYVRMMLMGNWYGWLPDQDPATDQPSMLVGYTTADTSNEEMVDNWFGRKEPYSLGFDDTFTDGKPNAAEGNLWVFGTGSYYYYPEVIGAGEKLSQTAALFQSYTLDPTWVPDIYIPVGGVRKPAKGVHLVFECVVQAISAKDANGTPYADWKAAWSAATGQTIDVKN